jgi:hypothetical protein
MGQDVAAMVLEYLAVESLRNNVILLSYGSGVMYLLVLFRGTVLGGFYRFSKILCWDKNEENFIFSK